MAMLAQRNFANQVAEACGVSAATMLNWMDWAWRHRDEVDSHMKKHHPELTADQTKGLWYRISRRRAKRERRLDLSRRGES